MDIDQQSLDRGSIIEEVRLPSLSICLAVVT